MLYINKLFYLFNIYIYIDKTVPKHKNCVANSTLLIGDNIFIVASVFYVI